MHPMAELREARTTVEENNSSTKMFGHRYGLVRGHMICIAQKRQALNSIRTNLGSSFKFPCAEANQPKATCTRVRSEPCQFEFESCFCFSETSKNQKRRKSCQKLVDSCEKILVVTNQLNLKTNWSLSDVKLAKL